MARPLVYWRADTGTLTLSRTAVRRMARHLQFGRSDREACGVLLGRYLVEGGHVVIDEVTEPQPSDRRRRTSFVRSVAHQPLVEAAFWESGGTRVYAGEWHTHPEALPSPSGRDLSAWRKKLLDERVIVDTLFFIIVGTQDVTAWEGDCRTGQIEKLTRLRYSEPVVAVRLGGTDHVQTRQEPEEPQTTPPESSRAESARETKAED